MSTLPVTAHTCPASQCYVNSTCSRTHLPRGRPPSSHAVTVRHVGRVVPYNRLAGWLPPSSASGLVFTLGSCTAARRAVIVQAELSAYDLENLLSHALSLCARLKHLPCSTPMHRHCQSLMATQTMEMLRSLLSHSTSAHKMSSSATEWVCSHSATPPHSPFILILYWYSWKCVPSLIFQTFSMLSFLNRAFNNVRILITVLATVATTTMLRQCIWRSSGGRQQRQRRLLPAPHSMEPDKKYPLHSAAFAASIEYYGKSIFWCGLGCRWRFSTTSELPQFWKL